MSELKPCPFCGGKDVLLNLNSAQCGGCGASIIVDDLDDNGEGARMLWNRRTPAAPSSEAGEVCWMVAGKDGYVAKGSNGEGLYLYERSDDAVTVADNMWPANAPHRCIPLYASSPPAATAGYVTVPREPTPELLMSMALRLYHALGCPGYYDEGLAKREGITHARVLEVALADMGKVYEEVVGRGFYRRSTGGR